MRFVCRPLSQKGRLRRRGADLCARKHGRTGLRQAAGRPYLRRPWRLLYPHPILGLGVVALKVGEAVAMATALTAKGLRRRHGQRR
jgi:hypothetical protein